MGHDFVTVNWFLVHPLEFLFVKETEGGDAPPMGLDSNWDVDRFYALLECKAFPVSQV